MRVLIGAVIVALGIVVLALPSSADDAPGCEGLDAYAEAMFEASLPLPLELDDSPFTMSSSDWLAFAESSLEFQDRIAAIEPPPWAADWHEARLDAFGFREQLGRLAAEEGPLAIVVFEETVSELTERYDETEAATIATCPDFEQFAYEWDALDGNVDGTPVATPVR